MKSLKTKIYFSIAAFLLVMLGFTVVSNAQVTSVKSIAIQKIADMSFGTIAVSAASGGTVILNPDGSRSASGGITLPATSGNVAAASFDVTGEGGYTYSITLPGTNHTLSSGANSMIVNAFTSTPASRGTLSLLGAQTLTVGATLNIAAGQPAGTYTSETVFEVTVNYE